MSVTKLNNSLIEHKLAILRNKNTGTKEFRELVSEVAVLLCYEIMKDAPLKTIEIETPMTKMKAKQLEESNYVFMPILRAGMGMVDGIIRVIPNAKFGHIGIYRNEETLEAIRYYYKAPSNLIDKTVIILDPMLATGGSAVDTIKALKEDGVKNIKILTIIAAPEGLEKVNRAYPEVSIYTAAIDSHLNEIGYIVPGLGDAGDRIFGTNS